MVLEHALLPVRPGQEEQFEAASGQAEAVIAAVPGFRGSEQYEQWRRLLHGSYDPFPVVEHFARVHEAGPGAAAAPA